jgi:hypothetical protein
MMFGRAGSVTKMVAIAGVMVPAFRSELSPDDVRANLKRPNTFLPLSSRGRWFAVQAGRLFYVNDSGRWQVA